jgi:NitT/TauT family transport system permease protein
MNATTKMPAVELAESSAMNAKPIESRPRRAWANRPEAVVAGWILVAGAFLGLWEWGGATGRLNQLFFSRPSAIWGALMEGVQGTLITMDARYTLLAVLFGFVGAAVAGVAAAFALSQMPYLRKVLNPFFTAFNSLPRVALAPLFVMWFGIGLFSHVMMAASLTFFVVFWRACRARRDGRPSGGSSCPRRCPRSSSGSSWASSSACSARCRER